ncbi:effector-associated constant component EACC1 [Actinomycetospora aeridis]|uniref:Caspase family protein n=1 Tax=Actinomycetospora aeridis TaxID=3129231 RepID=A0ABU8MZ12_9PSEU
MDTIEIWIVGSDENRVDDPLLLNSLQNSLISNRYVKENAEVRRPESPSEEMGPDPAVIQLVFYGVFELANLAMAFSEWRAKRREDVSSVAVKANGRVTILHPEDMADANDSGMKVRRASSGAPDPKRSRCVLIGISDYVSLRPLHRVAHNIKQLQEVFGDVKAWGIPDDRIHVITYTQSAQTVLDQLVAAADDAPDTLLVYFAGHGLYHNQELLLALPEATGTNDTQTVRWQEVARIVRQADSERKIVWLDCCYAAHALPGEETNSGPGEPLGLLESARRDGIYLLGAAQKSEQAMSPSGSGCTPFTGELVGALRRGIELDPPESFLSLNSLHQKARVELNKKRLPRPVRHDPSEIGNLPHFHNNYMKRAPRWWNPLSRRSSGEDPRQSPRGYLSRKAVAVVAAALVALAALVWFVPGADVSGLDLAKYCGTQAPGGTQDFELAGTSCVRPIDLDDACVYSYNAYGLYARPTSRDVNSVQCFNSPSSSVSRGGIPDMDGYCANRTKVPGVMSTTKNSLYPNTWTCETEIDLDAACVAQNNRSDVTSREGGNGALFCHERHWF